MANEGSTKPTYEELEEILESIRYQFRKAYDVDVSASKVIEDLLRVRGLLQRQWISVEERLPTKLTRVIGWCVVGIEHLGLFVCWMNSQGEWHDSHGAFKEGSITHWMSVSAPNFQQSSDLVSQGAESADIGKLDTADKSGKVNRVEEKADV